jgi:hypothetical protein
VSCTVVVLTCIMRGFVYVWGVMVIRVLEFTRFYIFCTVSFVFVSFMHILFLFVLSVLLYYVTW